MPLQTRYFIWAGASRYHLLFALPLVCIVLCNKSISARFRGLTVAKFITDATRSLLQIFIAKSSPYEMYLTREQEDDYWRNAEIGQRELAFSDARFASGRLSDPWGYQNERQILYYTPRLLPEYRRERSREGSSDFVIPAKAFVKWHWLVFPDRHHPGPLQASRLMKRFSPSDFREIYRIARLERTSKIALRGYGFDQQKTHGSRYGNKVGPVQHATARKSFHDACQERWRTWIQNREPELIICFEGTG